MIWVQSNLHPTSPSSLKFKKEPLLWQGAGVEWFISSVHRRQVWHHFKGRFMFLQLRAASTPAAERPSQICIKKIILLHSRFFFSLKFTGFFCLFVFCVFVSIELVSTPFLVCRGCYVYNCKCYFMIQIYLCFVFPPFCWKGHWAPPPKCCHIHSNCFEKLIILFKTKLTFSCFYYIRNDQSKYLRISLTIFWHFRGN